MQWKAGNEDCWYKCNQQGGSCKYCSDGDENEGYCCRKDFEDDNGDCPRSAMDFIPSDQMGHVCVSQIKG